jgi:hydrogenase maturation protease
MPDGETSHPLVLGLGNPLRGDDGLGPAVIAALRGRAGRGLTLIESDGYDLLEWLASETFERIVIVDAADLGQAPGRWLRLTPEQLAAASNQRLSHGMGLMESLALLAVLGQRPPAMSIYAIQPAAVGWGPGISLEVVGAVAAVATAILQELAPPKARREGRYSGQTRTSVACPAAARRDN